MVENINYSLHIVGFQSIIYFHSALLTKIGNTLFIHVMLENINYSLHCKHVFTQLCCRGKI